MSRTTQDINSSREGDEDEELPAKKRKKLYVNGDTNVSNSSSLLQTLFQSGEQQHLQIVQSSDGTAQIVNAETLETLNGVVIAVTEPSSPSEASQAIGGKIWQVVPCDDNSGTLQLHNLLLHTVIAVGESDGSTPVDNDEVDAENTDVIESTMSAETLASMLRSPPLVKTLPPDTPSWALKLRECEVIGDSYRGWVASEAELDLILTFHKQQTKTYWGTRQSPSTQRQSTRLMWKSQYVPFDGIPFINAGSRAVVMECQFGPRRKGQHSKRVPDSLHTGAYRQTCPARIYVKKVRKFPQYAVPMRSDRKYVRMAMDRSFQELKAVGLQTHGEDRWYVQLPTAKAHEFHLVDADSNDFPESDAPQKLEEPTVAAMVMEKESSNLISRMHPRLVEKINELVQKRETRVYTIRKQLRKFVETEMFESVRNVPDRHNLCYFPTVHDIQNHIFQAMKEVNSGTLPLLEVTDFVVECDESEDGNSSEPVPSSELNEESSAGKADSSGGLWTVIPGDSKNVEVCKQEQTPTSASLATLTNFGDTHLAVSVPVKADLNDSLSSSDQPVQYSTATVSHEAVQLLSQLPTGMLTTTGFIKVEDCKVPNMSMLTLITQSEPVDAVSSDHTFNGPATVASTLHTPSAETSLITVTMGEGGEILHIQNHTANTEDNSEKAT